MIKQAVQKQTGGWLLAENGNRGDTIWESSWSKSLLEFQTMWDFIFFPQRCLKFYLWLVIAISAKEQVALTYLSESRTKEKICNG